MNFFDTQNPGIGGLDELTTEETIIVQNITALGDPNADRILFWDDSAGSYQFLTVGSGLTITDTTITASAGSGDVLKVGTPVNNQVGVWTGDGTLEGDASLTFDTTTDLLTVGAGAGIVLTHSVKSDHSDGLLIEANNGTDVALLGAGNTANATFYGNVSMNTTGKIVNLADPTSAQDAATKIYVDGLVAGLLDYRGAYDASVNTFPASGGSGTAGAVLKGDMWVISVAGTLGGTAVQIGDSLIANVDTPAQTSSNWNVLNGNISYVPEDQANKSDNTSLGTSTSVYPTQNAVKVYADTKALLAGSTSQAFSVSQLEVGNTDTTISRSAAGKIAVEGVDVLTVAGGTLTGNIVLGENTSIDLDPAGSADGKYSGICITGTAGAALAFGDLIYLAVADSRWELTDADATATSGTPLIGMCVLAAAADGDATKILLQGTIRADAKFPTLTVGAPAYVGETAGAIQTAIPTGADNVIRVVGRALTADELYFCPSQDHQVTVA